MNTRTRLRLLNTAMKRKAEIIKKENEQDHLEKTTSIIFKNDKEMTLKINEHNDLKKPICFTDFSYTSDKVYNRIIKIMNLEYLEYQTQDKKIIKSFWINDVFLLIWDGKLLHLYCSKQKMIYLCLCPFYCGDKKEPLLNQLIKKDENKFYISIDGTLENLLDFTLFMEESN